MSLKLHRLKIAKKVILSKDAVAVYLEVPDNLKEIFKYKQGQFLSVQFDIKGEKHRREYSLCSSPYYENDWVIAVKKTGNGFVSGFIYDELKAGDTVEVYPPQGKFFTELSPSNAKNYFLTGGGSGITPLLSIIKSVLFAEPESRVVLYYGNADEESIIFRKELDELQEKYSGRFSLYYTLTEYTDSWHGLKGMINSSDLIKLVNENLSGKITEAEYFICGPEVMMENVKKDLLGLDIPQSRIHIEYFTPPAHHEEFIPEDAESIEVKDRVIQLILDGSEHTLKVDSGVSILNAAIQADLDPPFSCKSGICTTCRAKLYSGKVRMDEREGLSDSEINDGYILTCQSHPLTDDVKIEYM